MAKIPTYTQEGKLPVHPLAPEASYWDIERLTSVSGAVADMGRGIASLGSSLMARETEKAAKVKQLTDAANRLDAANQQNIYTSEFVAGLRDRKDTDAWLPEYRTGRKARQPEYLSKITDIQEKALLQKQLEADGIVSETKIIGLSQARANEIRTNNLDVVLNTFYGEQRHDEALQAIEDAKKSYISEDQYQSRRGTWLYQKASSLPYVDGMKLITNQSKKGMHVNMPDLPPELRRSAATQLMAWENLRREKNDIQQDADRLMLYETIRADDPNKPFTYELAKGTSLPADEIMQFTNIYDKIQNEKIKTGISQTKDGIPALEAELTKLIDLHPMDITVKDIYDLVPKGLGTDVAPRLVTRLRTAQEEAGPNAKYKRQLASAYEAGLLGSKDEAGTHKEYLERSNKLDRFMATNPTDAEAEKFFIDLIKPSQGFWGTLFEYGWKLPAWYMGGGATTTVRTGVELIRTKAEAERSIAKQEALREHIIKERTIVSVAKRRSKEVEDLAAGTLFRVPGDPNIYQK